ncbi:uncharacterized protein LOC142333910 [Lycorma delicatula]|uniref:uncharacterized protein LOC142333910 n=1 Tax=Lycorma delicatula TaxID=130591 RepID=UPI003F519AA2
MWRIQVLLMYFILTTMLVGSNNVCKKYRDGIHKENENRNYGYTDKQTIQSYSNMYCKKFDEKPQHRLYHFGTCSKLTDKYLRLVGETEDDINMFALTCNQRGMKWYNCINIMLELEKRCWDMYNAAFLITLVEHDKLMYIVEYTDMHVYYTTLLWMKNFQPLQCMENIVHNTSTRETVFVQFYYKWFKNQPNAKGCNCNKVINLYNSTKSSEERVKLLERQCL